ncbi:MAG TPA: hypothetical protein VJS40_07280 [Aestuariivirgaceae bacterium]|jgi:hypothetical protein|nr:hypothetical protein [Aestuariivirgaceae bacterium]
MTKILEFPQARVMARATRERSGPAEIFIFPGVRIERREYNLSDRTKPLSKLSPFSLSQAIDIDDR